MVRLVSQSCSGVSLLHNFRFIHVGIGHFVFNMLMQVILIKSRNIYYLLIVRRVKIFRVMFIFDFYIYTILMNISIISSTQQDKSFNLCDIEESSTFLVDVPLNSF